MIDLCKFTVYGAKNHVGIIELFPGEYVHIGGDKAPKTRWEESEYVQDLMAREGFNEVEQVQGYFIRRIERFLNDRYPGAKVVERDYDDGCLELTILHENLRKEVLFDGRNNWLRTEWELHRLPQNILDAVQQAGYTLDDDEFECIETSGGMWYEFEARKDRREYDLRVDTNGNIEAYED